MFIKRIFKLSVLLVFMMMNITLSVQATDNYNTSVIQVNDNLEKAFNSNENLLIKSGEYVLTSLSSISSNVTITGENDVVVNGNKKLSLNISGLKNVEFKNLKFKNFKSMSFKDSRNIKFTNCQFDGFIISGIYLDKFDNVEFSNCVISNIGSAAVDPTWQGVGIYSVNGTNIKIHDTEFYKTYGHGAIFLTDSNFEIYNNSIHDTFYRGIELYQSGNSGIIRNNNIYNSGSINTTNSGVGCNGIYSNGNNNVVVENNIIKNVLENGIEGNYKSVKNNTIDGTGIDIKKHATPSGEGIYFWGSTSVVGNIIKNSYKAGIKSYSVGTISDCVITENKIYDTVNSDYAIELNSEKGYSNINITDNIYNEKYCAYFRDKDKVNVNVNRNSKE